MLNRSAITAIALLLILSGTAIHAKAQRTETPVPQTDSLNRKRLALVAVTGATAYAGSITGLYNLWYKNYPQTHFHLFNDNREWLQMDKTAHVMAPYYLSLIGYSALRWSGVPEKKATWIGGITGLLCLTSIEFMDGLSKEWGFSTGDMIANTTGTALFVGQQLAWHEQKIILKYSSHSSPFAKYNPEQLGHTSLQHWVKDYNGQTYWLSANISSLGLQHTRFPKWINIAAGYGAEGMTGAFSNPAEVDGVPVPYSERYRQFYIAPDIDLSRIPVKSKTLKLILNTIGFLKIPMPTIEFNKNGVKFHPLYF